VNATAADSAIQTEARDWALAVFGERLPGERLQSFRHWLDADPRHAQAYGEAERLMLALSNVDALASPAKAKRNPWIWAAAALPLAACLAIGVGAVTRPVILESGRTTETLALRDGSTAILAPETRLRQTGWLNDRHYALERGEALFDVKHAAERPFRVLVGDARITVLGTRFDVRRGVSGEIGVAVQRGRVAVQREAGGPTFRAVLTQGDMVTLDKAGARREHLADATMIDGWRRGRLSYTSARIADVAADINRFSSLRVAADPALADVRLTTSFRVDQAGAFVANLPTLMAVEVQTRSDGVLLITPNRKAPRAVN
jgi:transmembrane sensor